MRFVDWFLRDHRTGRIVIAQWPNAALTIFLVARGVQLVLDPSGGWGTALRVVSAAALTWWAVAEIVRGANPWRRLLGAVVLAGVAASLLG